MTRGWAVLSGAAVALAVMTSASASQAQTVAQTCRGPAPAAGQTVSGPVLHVIDGRTLCIAQGSTPDHWVPLRVSASVTLLPDDRERLMAATFSHALSCRITGGRDAVKTATCTLAGRPLDDLLTAPATITEATAWR